MSVCLYSIPFKRERTWFEDFWRQKSKSSCPTFVDTSPLLTSVRQTSSRGCWTYERQKNEKLTTKMECRKRKLILGKVYHFCTLLLRVTRVKRPTFLLANHNFISDFGWHFEKPKLILRWCHISICLEKLQSVLISSRASRRVIANKFKMSTKYKIFFATKSLNSVLCCASWGCMLNQKCWNKKISTTKDRHRKQAVTR